MTKTNLLKNMFAVFAFLLVFMALPSTVKAAPRIYFEPSTYTTSQGNDFTVKILIDVESNSTFGADAILNFNSNEVTLKSIENGGFFSDFSKATSNNNAELHGFFSATYQNKTGSGTFATLTFSPTKTSGTGSVSFSCNGSGNDTFILNSEGNNILNCSSINQLNLSYGGASQSNNNNNTDTNAGGPTNACGGTCGSHYNCNSGLFCSNGFCRNPDCPSDLTCGCRAPTPTATPRVSAAARSTAKPSIKPTPQAIVLKKYTPAPLVLPTEKPADEVASAPKINLKAIALWSGLALLAVLVISLIRKYLAKHKGKNLPPNIPSSPPPMAPPPFLPPDLGPPTP